MNSYFQGTVKLYKDEFYVNANTGEGFDKILKKIDPLLFKISNKLFLPNYSPADVKQELAIIVIEGIRAYDPSKNAKLSTFLHVHLHNKIISKINSKNKMRNNATSFSESNTLPLVCECGSSNFYVNRKGGEEVSRECSSCDKIYRKDIRVAKKEICFTDIASKAENSRSQQSADPSSIEDLFGEDSQIFGAKVSDFGRSETEASIDSICESLDEKTAQIVRLVAIEGLNIKEAAEEAGISPWNANLRLKSLSRKHNIRELLTR
jgi:RNA polymerase sigma factor (sigma-70 family)